MLPFFTSTWNCLSRCTQPDMTAAGEARFWDNTDDARRRDWIYRHLTIGMTDIRETSVSAVIIKDLLNHRSADLWHKPSLLPGPTDAPAGRAGKRCFARLRLPPPPLPHWNEIPHPISAIGQVWKGGDSWSDIAVVTPYHCEERGASDIRNLPPSPSHRYTELPVDVVNPFPLPPGWSTQQHAGR